MSAYLGSQVRVVHGYTDSVGNRIASGTVGTCISDIESLICVVITSETTTRTIRLPHSMVDIVTPNGDEIAWVND